MTTLPSHCWVGLRYVPASEISVKALDSTSFACGCIWTRTFTINKLRRVFQVGPHPTDWCRYKKQWLGSTEISNIQALRKDHLGTKRGQLLGSPGGRLQEQFNLLTFWLPTSDSWPPELQEMIPAAEATRVMVFVLTALAHWCMELYHDWLAYCSVGGRLGCSYYHFIR